MMKKWKGRIRTDHFGTKDALLLLLEVLEDFVGVAAVNVGLGHHGEGDTVVL